MDEETLSVTFLFVLLFIFSPIGFYNMGAFYGRKEAINQTTIECIEKPNVCKDRYEYLKLGEKLGGNK
jgi:hypothetical protein